jgi:hypothetical protein
MNRTLLFAAFTVLFSTSADAEIFRCEQADGTTVFAHVPCRVERPAPTANNNVELGNIESNIESSVESSAEKLVAIPRTIKDIESSIEEIEIALGDLREAREIEIANAPFSAADSTALTQLKRDIRAAYQDEIDQRLSTLLTLRERRSQLITNPSPSINAD